MLVTSGLFHFYSPIAHPEMNLPANNSSPNTVRLACFSQGRSPQPPLKRGAILPLYPLFKGVAAGGGILSEPYFSKLFPVPIQQYC
jgi:hypothetical protein